MVRECFRFYAVDGFPISYGFSNERGGLNRFRGLFVKRDDIIAAFAFGIERFAGY